MEGWCKLCFGTVQHPRLAQECKERGGNDAEDTSSSASSASDPESYTVTPPLVSILAAMDQVFFGKYLNDSIRNVLFHTFFARKSDTLKICIVIQATVVQVFEYHLNWFEATGFSEEQVQLKYVLVIVQLYAGFICLCQLE